MRRVVWSYWDGTWSALLTKCEESWRRHLEDDGWDIRILGPSMLVEYGVKLPPSFDGVIPALQADYVRLALLERHGGVWMDATVFLTASLDKVVAHLAENDVVAFQRRKDEFYIENWFLAVRAPRLPLMSAWKDMFVDIISSGRPYASHPAYAIRCQMRDEYFVAYQAYCAVLRREPMLGRRVHVFGVASLWHPFVPMSSFRPLVKLTSGAREAYRYVRFPLSYLFIIALCTVVALGVAACVALPQSPSAITVGDGSPLKERWLLA